MGDSQDPEVIIDPAETAVVDPNQKISDERLNALDELKLKFKPKIQERIDSLQKEILVLLDMYMRGDTKDEDLLLNTYLDKEIQLKQLESL